MYKHFLILLIIILPLNLIGQYMQIDMGPTSYVLCNDSTVTYYGINPMEPTQYYEKPKKLQGLDHVVMATTGLYDGYFLLADSTVWGIDIQKFEFPYNISFFKMPDLKGIVKITSEKFGHTAIDAKGDVWVWGADKDTELRSTETFKLNVKDVAEASNYQGGIVVKLNDGSVWQNYQGFADTSLKQVSEINSPKHIYSDAICDLCSQPRHNFAIDNNYCLVTWTNYNDVPVSIDCNVREAKLGGNGCQYLKFDGTVWRIGYNNLSAAPTQYLFPESITSIFVEDELLGAISGDGSIWQGNLFTDTIFLAGDNNEKFWTCANCSGQLADTTILALDTTINVGNPVILNPKSNLTYEYKWYPSTGLDNHLIPMPTATISENTEYTARISDSAGCTFSEKFNLRVRNCDTIIENYTKTVLDTVIIPETEITIHATGYGPYTWNPATGINNVSGNEFTLSSAENSTYNLTQKDIFSCIYSQDYLIRIRNCDTIITEKYYSKLDTSVQTGTQLELHPSASYSTYDWLPNPSLSCTDCPSPVLDVEGNEIIYLNLYNSWNCPYSEVFTVKATSDIPEIQIPDIFTPNNDGINEYFEIVNKPENISVQVFNKYNVLVYNSDNYQNDWTGLNNNGEALEEDNYWYIINMSKSDIVYKGSVFIKR